MDAQHPPQEQQNLSSPTKRALVRVVPEKGVNGVDKPHEYEAMSAENSIEVGKSLAPARLYVSVVRWPFPPLKLNCRHETLPL